LILVCLLTAKIKIPANTAAVQGINPFTQRDISLYHKNAFLFRVEIIVDNGLLLCDHPMQKRNVIVMTEV